MKQGLEGWVLICPFLMSPVDYENILQLSTRVDYSSSSFVVAVKSKKHNDVGHMFI